MTDLRMSDLKGRSTSELLQQALALSHLDSEWENRNLIVAALEMRGDDETFEVAKYWCGSTDAKERKLAADLLNQFGERVHKDDGGVYFPSADQTLPLLEKLIDDPEPGVIASAVHGLGWNRAYHIILARPALAEYSSSRVRYAVASGLNGAESKAAIEYRFARR